MADTQLTSLNPNAGISSTLGSSSSGNSGSSTSSLFSDIGSGIGSFLNSPIGNLAEFGTLAGLGLSEASQAKSEAAAAAGQLTGAGAPYLSTGTNVLGQYNSGEPGSAAQQTQAAGTLGNIANTAFTNYQNGTLSPADQAALDAQTTAQKQAVAQQLANSGGTDQSALDTAYQQIDNNALMQRQNLLNAQFQTGQQALTQVQSTYNNFLQNALASSQFGLGALGEGLQLQITQDSQITQSLNDLFGQIARGFGTAMGGSGSGSSANGGTSSAGSSLGKAGGSLGNAIGSLLGSQGPNLAALGGAESSAIGDIGSTVGSTVAGDSASIAAGNDAWLASQAAAGGYGGAAGGGIAGSAAAAGLGDAALAPVGVEAATATPTITGLGADAAASGAAGGAGSGAGALAAGAGVGAAALGALYGLYVWDEAAGKYTPADQYNALANTSQEATQQTQQLQQAISSGKAVKGADGKYYINGIDASVYYPLAGMNAQQVSDSNAGLAQNFLTDQGTDWDLTGIGYTNAALRPQVSQSAERM